MAKPRPAAMFSELLRNFFHKPDTIKYPFERLTPTPEFRGRMVWEADKCTGCQACVRDCPTNVIDVVRADPDVRKFNVTYRMYLCIFCGQCVDSCPAHCVHWSDAFELASDQRQTIQYNTSPEALELARRQAAEKAAAKQAPSGDGPSCPDDTSQGKPEARTA
jgi:formate hydrogenlyase subunit 6/NADH:ubiquinone oxidoreductase subunit I